MSQNPLPDTESGGFYVQDVEFRSGVVAHQAPLAMAYTAALGDVAPPDLDAPLCYADLGCGDGTTVNALAACYPHMRFWGIDFNPLHIARAREMAAALGLANVEFVEASFAALEELALPDFDLIGMNGIYAWLEPPLAAAVRQFLRRRLRPGGLFYVEYTSLPGKAAVVPLWRLIQTLVPAAEDTPSRERAATGLDLLGVLAKRGMGYLGAHRPALNAAQSYLGKTKGAPYLLDHFAHNALASGFRPRYFTEMADEMAEAGLRFAGRSDWPLNDLELSVPPLQVPTFRGYTDVRVVETLKDYIRNEQSRCDVFVKEAPADAAGARRFLAERVRYVARNAIDQVERHVNGVGSHRVALRGPVYDRLIEAFDGDGATLAEVTAGDTDEPKLRQAAARLVASGQYFLCRDRPLPVTPGLPERIDWATPINRLLARRETERLTSMQTVSPITGGTAVPLGFMEVALLDAAVTAGFAGAVAAVLARFATLEQTVGTARGPRPVATLTAEELRPVYEGLRGRRLLNLRRLGVVTAI